MQKIAEPQVKSRDTAIFCFSTVKDRIMVILSIESDSGIVNVKKDRVKWYYNLGKGTT